MSRQNCWDEAEKGQRETSRRGGNLSSWGGEGTGLMIKAGDASEREASGTEREREGVEAGCENGDRRKGGGNASRKQTTTAKKNQKSTRGGEETGKGREEAATESASALGVRALAAFRSGLFVLPFFRKPLSRRKEHRKKKTSSAAKNTGGKLAWSATVAGLLRGDKGEGEAAGGGGGGRGRREDRESILVKRGAREKVGERGRDGEGEGEEEKGEGRRRSETTKKKTTH